MKKLIITLLVGNITLMAQTQDYGNFVVVKPYKNNLAT